ncbi:hypothetical protein DY245_02320 [Streptomyces inhibens]|uniref:DUF6924 domain-containing protein n=1 Tax=Streptomyces inhibens TaxID=2293571 RepID=A0A371QB06_STRIH|nr:hypothetical protein [Streptomyces inhibens]REK91896.1 hypothetical protein DY245_02320 [Streptomyces inhibens]
MPVIRTDFTNPDGWERLLQALLTPVGMRDAFQQSDDATDNYDRAVHYVGELDHDKYRGTRPGDVLAAAPAGHGLAYGHVYLADAVTFASDDLPLLGVDIDPEEERVEPFRVPALHVASVEANVHIANMFFSEFNGFDWDDRDLLVAGPGTDVWKEFERMDRYDEDEGDDEPE